MAKKKTKPARKPRQPKIDRDTATAIQLGELTKAVVLLTERVAELEKHIVALRLERPQPSYAPSLPGDKPWIDQFGPQLF